MPTKKTVAASKSKASSRVAKAIKAVESVDLPVGLPVVGRRSAPAKEIKEPKEPKEPKAPKAAEAAVAVAVAISKPKPAALTAEEKVAQRAVVVTDEAITVSQAVVHLNVIDVDVEKAAISFRNEVIKVGMKEAHALLDPIVQSAKASYDMARTQRDKALEPFENADRLILDALNGYETFKKRLWRQEQDKAEREQAEMERQAAIQRKEEERKAQAEIDRQLDELAAEYYPDDPPEALIQKITGVIEQYQEPVMLAPPIQVSMPESAGGITQQDNWKGRVLPGKEMEVLLLIIDGTLPLSIVEFPEPGLNKLAKLYQDKKRFEGLVFENKPFVRGTGR